MGPCQAGFLDRLLDGVPRGSLRPRQVDDPLDTGSPGQAYYLPHVCGNGAR